MPNIFGNNNVAPPGVPIPPGPMGPQGPQGPPGPTAIQEEGISLPARNFLNFVGTGVSASDDAAHNRVTVTVTGGGGGATPGGPVTSVQVNNAGALHGYSNLTYDGATLTGGQIQCTCINPSAVNDPSNRRAWDLNVTADALNTTPTFADANAFQINHTIAGGYYNADNTIQNKSTTMGLNILQICQGASQTFGVAVRITKDSMGDCGALNGYVSYRGGPLMGDEGQCYQCFTYLVQDTQIVTRTIVSVKRAVCPSNMVVTQAVVASKDPQTVNVSSTTGLAVNDWLVAGQSADTCEQHIRAVQVISFTGTTITGVIAVNMASGDALKAALLLGLQFGNGKFGQLMPIVNLSGASYSTGTVSSIAGGAFNGTGTAWAANMIGGDALNVGAISLVADNVTDTPFNATPPETPGGKMLRSWYQIWTVPGSAQLGINSYSVAAARSYRGFGPGSGVYLIKPAARALWFANTGDVVCEYSAHVWNVGDVVEATICPFPDVSLQLWNMSAYTPGGTYRGGVYYGNNGHRTFGYGICVTGLNMTGGDKPWAWDSGVQLDSCKTGVSISEPLTSAIAINCYDLVNHNPNIIWSGGSSGEIGLHGNIWDPGQLTIKSANSRIDFCSPSVTGGFPELRWSGNVSIFPSDGTSNAFFQIAMNEGPASKQDEASRAVGAFNLRAWRMEASHGSADGNLYFHYIDELYGGSAKTFGITNGASGPGPWLGTLVAKRGTATASVNYGSYEAIFESSIWHAGAAQQQYAMLRIEPESMAADAHNRFSIYIWDTLDANAYQPNRALSINDVGKLSIGNPNPFGALGHTATFDPTGITADRTLTLPDASGLIALTLAPSSFQVFPTETTPASGPRLQNGTWGYRFTVTRSALVSALGRLFFSTDTQDHFAGLWNADTHVLLASGTILHATASDAHNYKYVPVTSVLLVPGVHYTIGTTETAVDTFKDEFDLAGLVAPTITPDISMYTGTPGVEPPNPSSPGRAFGGPAMMLAASLSTGLATFDATGLTAPRTITIPDASGTMMLTPLPSASAGSGKLWYDPADSNRVKYTP